MRSPLPRRAAASRPRATPSDPSIAELVREDFRTHRRSRLSPGVHALLVHRVGARLRRDPRPHLRLLRPVHRLARAFVSAFYGIELPGSATIGRRLFLPHPQGVVVGGATIGDDCMIRHNVTIGAGSDTRGGVPTIGDRVQFGPGSIVMGAVHIGDDVLIGPGAVVVEDVPAGCRVLAPTATARPPQRRTDHGTDLHATGGDRARLPRPRRDVRTPDVQTPAGRPGEGRR